MVARELPQQPGEVGVATPPAQGTAGQPRPSWQSAAVAGGPVPVPARPRSQRPRPGTVSLPRAPADHMFSSRVCGAPRLRLPRGGPGLVRSPPAGGSRGQTAPRVPSGDGRLSPSTQAARARWRGDFNGTPPADLAEKEQEGSSSWEQPGRLEEARRVLCAQRPVAPASWAEVAGRQRGLRTGSGPHGCQRSSCCTASAVPP